MRLRVACTAAACLILAGCSADSGDRSAAVVDDSSGLASSGPNPNLPHGELLAFAYTCGDEMPVVASFRDPELVWLFLPGETLRLAQTPSASGARFTDGTTVFWIKGDEARLETEGDGPRSCREDRRRSFIEDAKLRGNDLWAVGNEPPWMLEIGPDSSVIIMGYERERHVFATPEPEIDAGVRRTVWRGETDLGAISIEVLGEECADDMSGERFEVRVVVTLADRLLRGCGQALH